MMKSRLLVSALLGLGLVALSVPAMAVMTNMAGDQPLVASPNVLTPDDGRSVARTLYCPSEADDPGYRAAIAGFTGGIVDYYDTRTTTPDATLLASYDCVYTWANYAYADNVTFGNRLADYVDGGGHVVLGAFCTYTSGNYLSGRVMTAGYNPVWSPAGNNHFSSSQYRGDGTTCIHTGVTSYECTYRDYLQLRGGGLQDGSFQDGEIAHAYRPDYFVIYSNGAGAAQLGCTGQWAHAVANACECGGIIPTQETSWGKIKSLYQ